MSEPVRWTSGQQPRRQESRSSDGSNLADILERVLDKGIVIAGDIQVNLLDIELLTIKIRLVVASVDRAKEMGIDWWERDPTLSAGRQDLEEENHQLRARIATLEKAMGRGELTDEPHGEEPADDADDPEDGAAPDGSDPDPGAEPEESDEQVDDEEQAEEPDPPRPARESRRRSAGPAPAAQRPGARRGRPRER